MFLNMLCLQAISKDGKTAKRLLVMSRLVESDLGSLKPLLALRAAGSGDGHNASEMLVDQRYEGDSDAVPEGRRVRERKRSDSPDSVELHDRLDSRYATCAGPGAAVAMRVSCEYKI